MSYLDRCEPIPAVGMGGDSRNPPVLIRLKGQKEELESRLADLNSAIKALESNPEVYGVLEALNRLGHY